VNGHAPLYNYNYNYNYNSHDTPPMTDSEQPAHDTETDTDTDCTDTETTESAFFTHDDWSNGQPCPECGETLMHVVQVSTETYKHDRGDVEYMSPGAYVESLKIECSDCHELLLRHPAMDALNAV